MKEWKTYRLGDLIKISSGFPYKGEHIGHGANYILGMGCVSFKETFLHSGIRAYSDEAPERYIAKPGEIVLATRQQSDNLPILGMPAIIPDSYEGEKMIVGANLYKVQNESDFTNEYIYWLMKSPSYIHHIRSCQTGTTVRMITKANIEDFTFRAPEECERNRISNLLWNLENKIQLNRQINDNLEQQAQALYKSWFVDFEPFKDGEFFESEFGLIPEGWRVGALSDLTEITMGQSPSGKSYNETGDGMLFYQGRSEFGDRYPSIRLYTTEPSRIAEQNSVLLSVRAPVGDTNIAYNKCCIGRGLASIKAKHGFNSFIFYMVKSLKDQFDLYNGEGTVFGSINRDSLNSMKVIVPTNDVISDFEKIVAPLDFKYKSLFTENLLLTQQRDTLLPKLMSGELKINEIDC